MLRLVRPLVTFLGGGSIGEEIKGALIIGAIGAGIGAGAGAAIGFTVDYAVKHKRPEVLYVAN